MKHLILILSLLLSVTFYSCEEKEPEVTPDEPDTPVSVYTDIEHQGFTLKIKTSLKNTPDAVAAINLAKSNLDDIVELFEEKHLEVIRTNPVWIEKDINEGAAWFHVSASWLQENGMNPEKVECVEISNYVNYVAWTKLNQPLMLLHEFCHMYHFLELTYEYAPIKEAYNNAVAKGMYLNTPYFNGSVTFDVDKAYAMNNQMEYFSEISEAYFGTNDYYPFNYEELKEYDPLGFALLEEIWGKRE